MKITDLPSDVRLIVLSHLDFPSLARIVRSHSSFNSVWQSYPEHLNHLISIRTGHADSKTVGSAAPLGSEGWERRVELDKEPSEQELKDVTREQRSMSCAFNAVRSFTDYAKTRRRIDRNWKHGNMSEEWFILDLRTARRHGLPGAEEIWRFKLDPVSNWIIVTGLFGGIWAFETNGKFVWYSKVPAGPFGHLESTYHGNESYLCTALPEHRFLIWRFHDPTKSEGPPPSHHLPDNVSASLAPHFGSLDPLNRGYHPFTIIAADEDCSATKLRYPYLVASSSTNNAVYRWNFVESPRESETVPISVEFTRSQQHHVTYLDLDADSVMVAGTRFVCFWKPTEQSRGSNSLPFVEPRRWPPEAPENYEYLQPLVPEPLYREVDAQNRQRPWTAVHHDSKSGFLVGASTLPGGETSVLTITYRYKEAIWSKDVEDVEQRTMNLRLDGVSSISQLSVENDRAVFVASSSLGHALFSVPLHPFNSLSEFVSSPPKPICISYPLPCLGEPSRLESTSTDIYLPICAPLLAPPSSAPWARLSLAFRNLSSTWKEDKQKKDANGVKFPFSIRWQTLDAQTLVNYETEGIQVGSRETKELVGLWNEVKSQAEAAGLDHHRKIAALMRYSFNVWEEEGRD